MFMSAEAMGYDKQTLNINRRAKLKYAYYYLNLFLQPENAHEA